MRLLRVLLSARWEMEKGFPLSHHFYLSHLHSLQGPWSRCFPATQGPSWGNWLPEDSPLHHSVGTLWLTLNTSESPYGKSSRLPSLLPLFFAQRKRKINLLDITEGRMLSWGFNHSEQRKAPLLKWLPFFTACDVLCTIYITLPRLKIFIVVHLKSKKTPLTNK